jgi:hypothetical protein
MKQISKTLLFTTLVLFTLASCKKESESTTPSATASLKGKFFISTVKNTNKVVGDDIETDTEDVSKSNYYYEFDGNGNFSSNYTLDVSGEEFNTDLIKGTYKVNGSTLTLSVLDKLVNTTIDQKYTIKKNEGKDFVILFDLASLKDQIAQLKKVAKGDVLEDVKLAEAFLALIEKLEIELAMTKV